MPVVLYEKRGRTVIITLNRPDAMNAINTEVRDGLRDSFTKFRDDDARSAIITGSGDKAFSAGADLKEMSERQHKGSVNPYWGGTLAVLLRQMELWKPVIAAINGYCLAGGLEIALACDIRIASENATFALTEVTRGIIPGNGGTQVLPRVMPLGRAFQMLFTGERIDAQEAYRFGLINSIHPQAELMNAALDLAEQINAAAPISIKLVKEAALKGLDLPYLDGLRLESLFSMYVHTTEDAKEGPLAFIQKRKADYKGR